MGKLSDSQFNALMWGLAGFSILAIAIIIIYPMFNMVTGEYKILDIYTDGSGLYRIKTDTIVLNVSDYYNDVLLKGHTYSIKFMDGIRVDRLIEYYEIEVSK